MAQIGLDDTWVGCNVSGGAAGDDAAVAQHIDAISKANHRLHDMLDEKNDDARVFDRAHDADDFHDLNRVEPGHDLVEQKQLGSGSQRAPAQAVYVPPA